MSGRAPALAAAALALAAAAVYVLALSSQDNQGIAGDREVLVVLSLGGAGLAELLASRAPSAFARTALASAGAFTLLVWTVLGAFSIGIFVLPAALLALVVTGRAAGELDGRAAAAAVGGGVLLAVVLAAAGLALTS